MAGKKNSVDCETLTFTVAAGIVAHLRDLTATHFYGKNENETAALILIQEVRRLVMSGELKAMLDNRPTHLPQRKTDAESSERD